MASYDVATSLHDVVQQEMALCRDMRCMMSRHRAFIDYSSSFIFPILLYFLAFPFLSTKDKQEGNLAQ